jgi:hypothetical protein
METGNPDSKRLIIEDQHSSNGNETLTKPRTREEDLAAILAAFERGKQRLGRVAESTDEEGNGSVMEFLRKR